MKKLTLITAIILTANLLFAQYNKIDTSFYSEALQENKMVDVYFPPGYNENPEIYYPVIYYLHFWTGDQNTMATEMMSMTQTLINNGTISPVIMVCADNSPGPFDGSMYTNSILWGDYEDYMTIDLINWIESSFRAMPGKDYRGLLGHSMGGYGAWRFGTLHKDKFRVLAATAAPYLNLTDSCLSYTRTKIIQQNQPGPPYFYDYYSSGSTTMGVFLFSGAFTPNYNTPQTYINPAIVEFGLDENGNYIDTIMNKGKVNSISHLIHQLSPADSVGILVGCGTADISAIEPHRAFIDTLDMLGLPYEYYEHSGGHIMPPEFKQMALIFIDSLLMPPLLPSTNCLPEGITFSTQEEIDNFHINHPNCTEIEGDVQIEGDEITNLNGLNVLTGIGGRLRFYTCTALQDFTGLENLTTIGGDLIIYVWPSNTTSLTTLSGMNNLISVGGALEVTGTDVLINLSGLENLTTIGENIEIGGNEALSNLTGLNNLTSIGGDIWIGENTALTSLTGLENLTTIGGSLEIFDNDALTSLVGIEHVEAASINSLSISYNSLLSACAVQSVCDYLIIPGSNVDIYDNAPGCNSQQEVEDACDSITFVKNEIVKPDLTISPNPIDDLSLLSVNIRSKSSVEVCIYNTTGICLRNWQFPFMQSGQTDLKLDLKDLPAGVYFCRVQIGNEMVTKKIIKTK